MAMSLTTKIVLGAAGLFVASNIFAGMIERRMLMNITKAAPIIKPSTMISINVCTLNEEATIEECLKSIREQTIMKYFPDMFEVILIDSYSEDKTVEKAQPYVDKVILAPRGKLTARNIGVINSRGDIIVSIDADSLYPPEWLGSILYYFQDKDVVAINGGDILINPKDYMTYVEITMSSWLRQFILQLNGKNMAFKKWAWQAVGGWRTEGINQQNLDQLWKEEEFDFTERMSKIGKVLYSIDIPCFTIDRRQRIGNAATKINPALEKKCAIDLKDAMCQFYNDVKSGKRF